MRCFSPLMLVLAAGHLAGPAAWGAEASLPLSGVTVYQSGVAAFVHEGRVHGDATLTLDLSPSELSDALKTLVVIDRGATAAPRALYEPARDLESVLGGYSIDPRRPLMELLASVRGEPVRLRLADGVVEGVVYDTERLVDRETGAVSWTVTVLTEAGFRSINRIDIVSVDFVREELAAEMRAALSAIAAHRDVGDPRLRVRFTGEGERAAMATYVHAAPVWKASYRLVLPEADGDALLQAWAVVENQSDRDWEDVTLTVSAGRPVSFTMDLQTPFTPARPEVVPPYALSLAPTAYERDLLEAQKIAMEDASPRRLRNEVADRTSMGMSALAPQQAALFAEAGVEGGALSAQSSATGVEAGSQFVFTFDKPVTLARGASSLLPLASERVDAKRVTIFNPAGAALPMSGLELTNSAGIDLMAGPIAVYDAGSYAGDAQIDHVSKGENRLVSFAADQDVLVTTESAPSVTVASVTISDGLLIERVVDTMSTTYTLVNRDRDRGRTVYIEHPKRAGWTLTGRIKPSQESASSHRFEAALKADDSVALTVSQERERFSRYAVADYNIDALLTHARRGAASEAVKNAVLEAARLQSAVRETERALGAIQSRFDEIAQDQDRLRKNMNQVGRGSDLWNRYAAKLGEQENEIERLAAQRDDLRVRLEGGQRALREFLRDLDVK